MNKMLYGSGGLEKMQHKIVGIVICLLITIGSFPLTVNITSQDIENHVSINDVKIRESREQNYLLQQQNILTFGCAGDADKLDPADVTDSESVARTDSIFEELVEFKSGTTEIQPCLATSWTFSPDGINI